MSDEDKEFEEIVSSLISFIRAQGESKLDRTIHLFGASYVGYLKSLECNKRQVLQAIRHLVDLLYDPDDE